MDITPISEGFDAEFAALIQWALKDDPSAVEAAEMLWSATHVWDDLVDRDRHPSHDEISGAFWVFAVGLRRNGFWRTHEAELQPLLEQGIYDWLDANRFEHYGKYHVSFALRCSVLAVIIKMSQILGGLAWARMVSGRLREYVMDDYEEYVRGLEEQAKDSGSIG